MDDQPQRPQFKKLGQRKPKPLPQKRRQVYDPNTGRIVPAKTDEQLRREAEQQAEWDEIDEIEAMPEPEEPVTLFHHLAVYLGHRP